MRVYLAGPMRGYPQWNFPAFEKARQEWVKAGHLVFCPASTAIACGYRIPDDGNSEAADEKHIRHVLALDIAHIASADAIALLPNWQQSIGATFEAAVGQFLGLRFFEAFSMEEIHLCKRPWALLSSFGPIASYDVPEVEGRPYQPVMPVPTGASSFSEGESEYRNIPVEEGEGWRRIPTLDNVLDGETVQALCLHCQRIKPHPVGLRGAYCVDCAKIVFK